MFFYRVPAGCVRSRQTGISREVLLRVKHLGGYSHEWIFVRLELDPNARGEPYWRIRDRGMVPEHWKPDYWCELPD